jgi:ABC-type multidrug transport system fused ATPase/permease subunit
VLFNDSITYNISYGALGLINYLPGAVNTPLSRSLLKIQDHKPDSPEYKALESDIEQKIIPVAKKAKIHDFVVKGGYN